MFTQPVTSRSATSALGVAAGVAVLAGLNATWPGAGGGVSLVLAPLGASALLLFALPASPLAQPWPVLGGNTVSALAGVSCTELIGSQTIAAPAAVGAAVLLMAAARCLHPPGAAVALIAVVGPASLQAAGFQFVLSPVALGSVVLLAVAFVFNNLTGHRYPHHAPPRLVPVGHGTADVEPQERVGFTGADISAALERYGDLLDVSQEDLDALFHDVEAQIGHRIEGGIACGTIMSRDLVWCSSDDEVGHARDLLREHRLFGLPVLGPDRLPLGIVDASDLLDPAATQLSEIIRPAVTATPETPIGDLLRALSTGDAREALVLDTTGHLVGVVTQTDLLAALYRARIAETTSGT